MTLCSRHVPAACRGHSRDDIPAVALMAQLRSEHALIRAMWSVRGEQAGRTFLESPQRFDDALYGPGGLLAYVQARYDLLREALAGSR